MKKLHNKRAIVCYEHLVIKAVFTLTARTTKETRMPESAIVCFLKWNRYIHAFYMDREILETSLEPKYNIWPAMLRHLFWFLCYCQLCSTYVMKGRGKSARHDEEIYDADWQGICTFKLQRLDKRCSHLGLSDSCRLSFSVFEANALHFVHHCLLACIYGLLDTKSAETGKESWYKNKTLRL